MNVPGPVRWWTPRQPGWLRNTVIAVIVGLAAGLGVLAVVAPLSPEPDAIAGGTPPVSPSPSWSLTLPMLSSSPSPSGRTSSRPRSPSVSSDGTRGAGIAARYAVKDSWSGGYSAEIVVTATQATDGWTIVLTFPDGVDATTAWEADYRQNGRTVTLTPKSWNRTLAAGAQIVAGIQLSGSGQPLSCAINGTPCA
ncbi:MAG: hypothetical protein HOV77_22280 [Hamadaea sp.]|uniref:cellulose binding domain-containing protein n=1 Tax=Hamadaea sp. TaxID=2024425 RepID=UPI0017F76639|nr:cellulose binding domain-containing protein [Hamadaea sp.]NUT21910.1 hypothetical protein [Hamadaea sp.]